MSRKQGERGATTNTNEIKERKDESREVDFETVNRVKIRVFSILNFANQRQQLAADGTI